MANEKRLISLDEAIAKVKDDGILGEGYSDDERIDDVCDILESCEIVDVMEVVRCKGCKHWGGVVYGGRCKHWSAPMSGMTHYTSADDFCSYGERKEDGKE